MKQKTGKRYLVYSRKATLNNPSRVWMNIAVNKLKKAAETRQSYYFEYDAKDRGKLFYVNAQKLQRSFEKGGVPIISSGTRRYSFYLDIEVGAIFSTLYAGNTTPVIQLKEAERGIIFGMPKKDVSQEDIPYLERRGGRRRNYDQLDNQGKEMINTYKLAALLAEYGFECLTVKNDKNGPDIIAYHSASGEDNPSITLYIQVKGRLTIKESYRGKELMIAFPVKDGWYLIPHDGAIENIVPPEWLETKSWKENGIYHRQTPPEKVRDKLKEYFIPYRQEETKSKKAKE